MDKEQLAQLVDLGSILLQVAIGGSGAIDADTFEPPVPLYVRKMDGKLYARLGSPPIESAGGRVTGMEIPASVMLVPGLQSWIGNLDNPCEFRLRLVRKGYMKDATVGEERR